MRITQARRTVKDVAPQMDKLQGQTVSQRAVNAMFNNPNTAGLNKLASGLMTVANTAATIDDDIKNTNARDAANRFQQSFMEWQSEQQKKQGKHGMNSEVDYAAWQKAKYEEISKDLNGVERARFQMMADPHNARQANWAAEYGYREKTRYEDGVFEATLATQRDSILKNFNDPVLVEANMLEIGAAIKARNEKIGVSAEKTELDIKTELEKSLVPAIELQIVEGQLGLASQRMKLYSPMLGEKAKVVLGKQIKNEQKRMAAEARAAAREAQYQRDKKIIQARKDLLDSETKDLWNLYQNDPASVKAYVEANYADDPEMADALTKSFLQRANLENSINNAIQIQEKQDFANKANEFIENSFKDGLPKDVTKLQVLVNSAPEDMRQGIENAIELKINEASGIITLANPAIEYSMNRDVAEASITPQELKQKYQGKVSTKALNTAVAVLEKEDNQQAEGALRSEFNSAFALFDIESLAEKAGLTPSSYRTLAYDRFTMELNKRNIFNPDKKIEFINTFLRGVLLRKEGYVWDDEVTVPSYAAPTYEKEGFEVQGYVEPERPVLLPKEAVWDKTRGGWTVGNKFFDAAKLR